MYFQFIKKEANHTNMLVAPEKNGLKVWFLLEQEKAAFITLIQDKAYLLMDLTLLLHWWPSLQSHNQCEDFMSCMKAE